VHLLPRAREQPRAPLARLAQEGAAGKGEGNPLAAGERRHRAALDEKAIRREDEAGLLDLQRRLDEHSREPKQADLDSDDYSKPDSTRAELPGSMDHRDVGGQDGLRAGEPVDQLVHSAHAPFSREGELDASKPSERLDRLT